MSAGTLRVEVSGGWRMMIKIKVKAKVEVKG